MKLLRVRLQEEASRRQVPLHIIEKDYAIGYVLAGIFSQSTLKKALVFKGGTALKKIFFGDYRFSEDLDFSTIDAPKNNALEKALRESAEISKNLLNEYGPFDVELKRKPERAPHPKDQEAFNLGIKFPWHPESLCQIKIAITHDELVILTPEYMPIIHGYDEQLNCNITCYHIEEIIAEKLRAILQTHQRLVTRGWNRPRARDYYDLWYILKNYESKIDKKRLVKILNEKCEHRNVSYQCIDDFFTEELIKEANQHWEATLGNFVKQLPKFELISKEIKRLMARFI